MADSGIFHAALKLPPVERSAYLDRACADNPQLRQELESLLRAHEGSAPLLQDNLQRDRDRPQETVDAKSPISEKPGTIIGPYRLMEKIGEGGFGLVFVAEQKTPIQRKVALKIIKPGMDTREVVARFEAERQALAVMDHPNIARVFDGGATESGRPYFVMELVRGIPINEWCDSHQLTARERLDLFLSVCQAVQHAHSKGIIHRDLKPSNILVTPHDGVPVVKVIDFGIAKAIGQRLTDKTIYTRFEQMIGTPLYMSPEQAEINALDVDIRSDIYSLGVLLYELLTGTTPFEKQRFQTAAYDEIRRIIKEEDPPTPSKRLSTMGANLSRVSSQRKTAPETLSALVRGDLDWIVMKCLDKDRKRRYETATELGKDIRRHLNEEPVEACPPSLTYRLRKLIRRNRGPVLLGLTMTALLLLGLVGTTIGLIQAQRAAERAASAEKEALFDRDAKEEALLAQEAERVAALKQRDEARLAKEQLRRTLYRADMNLLQIAWESNHASRVQELLEATRPAATEADLRGFEWFYWDRTAHSEVDVRILNAGLLPAQSRMNFAVMNAEGTRYALLTVPDPAKPTSLAIKLWNLQSGKDAETFPIEETGDLRLAMSGNGKKLAICSYASRERPANGKISIWDVESKKKIRSVDFPDGVEPRLLSSRNAAPLFSFNGRFLAAFIRGGLEYGGSAPPPSLMVWDLDAVESGSPTLVANVPPNAGLSADGTKVATLSLANTKTPPIGITNELRIIDAKTGKTLVTGAWSGFTGSIETMTANYLDQAKLVFDPAGDRIAAIQVHKNLSTGIPAYKGAIWDASGHLLSTFSPPQAIAHLAFSPDGKQLVTWTGERNPVGTIWDAATGEAIKVWKGPVAQVVATAFSADGNRFLTADLDGGLRTWSAVRDDYRSSTIVPHPLTQSPITTWSMNGERQFIRLSKKDAPSIRVCDESGKERLLFQEHKAPLSELEISPDGRFAFSRDVKGKTYLWDTASGKIGMSGQWSPDPSFRRIDMRTSKPRFSDDSRKVAFPVPEGGIKVWDLQNGMREIFWEKGPEREAIFSANSSRLALVDKVALRPLPPPESAAGPLPNPTRQVVVPDHSRDREMTIWKLDTGTKTCTIKGRILSCLFSPDGTKIAAEVPPQGRDVNAFGGLNRRNLDTEARIWDSQTGTELAHLKGIVANGKMAFSPDGKWLAAPAVGSTQTLGDILVWDIAAGEPHLRLKGLPGSVRSVVFSPDGKRLASAVRQTNPPRTEISLWDPSTGSALLSLHPPGLGDLFQPLYFSQDGNRLFTAGTHAQGTWLQIWDASPRKEPSSSK